MIKYKQKAQLLFGEYPMWNCRVCFPDREGRIEGSSYRPDDLRCYSVFLQVNVMAVLIMISSLILRL